MAFIKKNLAFILVNILISAATVLVVLFLWNHFQGPKCTPQAVFVPGQNQTLAIKENEAPVLKATNTPAKSKLNNDISVSINLVSGMGELKLEYILVKNDGPEKLSLLDWAVHGSEHQNLVIKSDIMLNPGGAIKIYTKEGSDSALAIYLNQSVALWKSGSTVTLLDPAQAERARYEIP